VHLRIDRCCYLVYSSGGHGWSCGWRWQVPFAFCELERHSSLNIWTAFIRAMRRLKAAKLSFKLLWVRQKREAHIYSKLHDSVSQRYLLELPVTIIDTPCRNIVITIAKLGRIVVFHFTKSFLLLEVLIATIMFRLFCNTRPQMSTSTLPDD